MSDSTGLTLVDQWLHWLATDQRKAANTVATYARTMRTLPDAGTATREDVEAWWDSRKHNTVATRVNELSALRSFYKWCAIWEHRDSDPTLRISTPKRPERIPHHISRADLHTLFASVDDEMRRAIALGAYGGLRVSEAAVLSWADIDLELNRMLVRGKGDKQRLVGLNVLLLDHLLPDTGGNVVAAGGRGYSAVALRVRVNRAFKTAGVAETFHACRHRYGTMAAASGVPLTSVARAMGHSSITTTQGYVSASDSDLDLIAEAVTR